MSEKRDFIDVLERSMERYALQFDRAKYSRLGDGYQPFKDVREHDDVRLVCMCLEEHYDRDINLDKVGPDTIGQLFGHFCSAPVAG